jgi:imidazole glycerol-phosphate synthase subunit HisH
MITIVDYGVGNLRSFVNILERRGAVARISADPADIAQAEKLILPGVGHFGAAMAELRRRGLVDALNRRVLHDRVPVLGVCLGMQLFARRSEEGDAEGLGWIDATVERLRNDGRPSLKIPNMGWRTLDVVRPNPLLPPADRPWRFYFLHSYYMRCARWEDVTAGITYGESVTAAVAVDNIFGTQFHPEKSHGYGSRLLGEFARL